MTFLLPRRAFGTTGLDVAALGIGALVGPPEMEVVTAINELLDAGANLVDTAQVYGDHESIIGRHLAHRRAEMVLVSKCGHHDKGDDGILRSRPISMDDVDTALRRLRTDYLDAMLLHSYDLEPLCRGDALAVLVHARQLGKIRYVGYSGDNERAAWAANCPEIAVLETSLNLVDQHNLATALPRCRERGVAVIAKRPLANAAWRPRAALADAHPSVLLYADRFAALGLDPAVYGCEAFDELALRFVLSLDGVHCLIASSANAAHRQRNLSLATRGPLPPATVAELHRHWQTCNDDWLGVN